MSDGPVAVYRPELPLPLSHRGKVREVYAVGDDHLLMVASDRVSAFDVVMGEPIPHKGEVLTQLTAWWLGRLRAASPHHLVSVDPRVILDRVPALGDVPPDSWARRSMLVTRTDPVPVECVVRGFLAGSAWREYRDAGTLAGERLPAGLERAERLPVPLFSPATKAQEGHDENIRYEQVVEIVGVELAEELRSRAFALYEEARRVAAERGILLADTKFEFGIDRDGSLRLIDEVLTPDSSRYWPRESYHPGGPQPSLDKQPVRDYLDALDWDKSPPPPPLPAQVIAATTERYLQIFRLLTGSELDRFQDSDGGSDGGRRTVERDRVADETPS